MGKGIAESAKNFKNISATVSTRQQMRMASVYYNGMFETAEFKLPEKVKMKVEILQDTEFNSSLRQFMGENDFICSEIFLNGQLYRNGDLVVIEGIDRDSLKVGLIQPVLVKSEDAYFVVRGYLAQRNNLGYFVTENQVEQMSSFTKASHLADFKPLIMHGTTNKFKFALHHNISFSHS